MVEAVFAIEGVGITPRISFYRTDIGQFIGATQITGATYLGGAAWHESRLYAIEGGVFPQELSRIHPASGIANMVGLTGFFASTFSMDTDVTSGIIYFFTSGTPPQLFTLDPLTGQGTLVSNISGPGSGANAMAVHPSGAIYLASVGPNLYSLDRATGQTTWLGSINNMPNGFIFDMTSDSAGYLWLSLDDFSSPVYRLFRVDLSTSTATEMATWSTPHSGLAVGIVCVPEIYCTAKTNSLGCLPALGTAGIPAANADKGFTITASNVRNARLGILLHGVSGPAALPFAGGLLCVSPPLKRTPSVTSGGNSPPAVDCSGSWSFDFNAYLWSKLPKDDAVNAPPYPFPPGTVVNCQWWGRDAPGNAALTAGVEFTLCP